MRILEYTGLDTTAIAKHYRKVTDAIAVGDFRAAQVKKLSSHASASFTARASTTLTACCFHWCVRVMKCAR